MSDEEFHSPWMCHVCSFSSNVGEGLVCSECYKISCRQHTTISSAFNPQTGLYELKQVCVECLLKKQL